MIFSWCMLFSKFTSFVQNVKYAYADDGYDFLNFIQKFSWVIEKNSAKQRPWLLKFNIHEPYKLRKLLEGVSWEKMDIL